MSTPDATDEVDGTSGVDVDGTSGVDGCYVDGADGWDRAPTPAERYATEPSPFRKLLSQTGVHVELVGKIADALSEDGVTNAHALERVPLHPGDHPETFRVLDAALPAEKAVVKASLADLGPSSSTAGAHTGDGATPTQSSKAVKEAALEGINELKLLQDGLQPFIDKAAEAEAGAQEESKAAEKEAVDSARAKLLELHALELPSNSTPGAAARYLDLAMDKLKLDVLPQQADLSVTDLVERNELMQCVHLHPSGADIAPCPVGQLHPGRSPFKNPRGPSYRLEDTDVETTKRHASMRQLDETVGSSWSVAASTKGAVFFGFGVAAWSASMSAAGANETKSSEIHETSSEATTHVKVKQAILSGAQFSLADRDWELTPDFESRLAEFVAIDEVHVTGLSDAEAHRDKQAVLAKRLLDDYGSHLATQAVLGGRYKIECHVTTELKTEVLDERKTVADALNCHASVAASAAGFFEVFAGAGESARSTGHASHTAAQSALQEMDETTSMKTMLRMTVTGGAPGNMAAWLNDLRKSNRGWEVVDRSPHRGLSPIWDLVRKSRRLSAEEQTEVSNSVKACFENGFEVAMAAAEEVAIAEEAARLVAKIFIVCGEMSGTVGGGKLYRVDCSTGAHVQHGTCDEWQNATVMASDGKSLFIVCGKMGGTVGGGKLYRVDCRTGAHVQHGTCDNWHNATVMASDGKSLFIVCGKMGGTVGGGKLYRVDCSTGAHVQHGTHDNWHNATVMAISA